MISTCAQCQTLIFNQAFQRYLKTTKPFARGELEQIYNLALKIFFLNYDKKFIALLFPTGVTALIGIGLYTFTVLPVAHIWVVSFIIFFALYIYSTRPITKEIRRLRTELEKALQRSRQRQTEVRGLFEALPDLKRFVDVP